MLMLGNSSARGNCCCAWTGLTPHAVSPRSLLPQGGTRAVGALAPLPLEYPPQRHAQHQHQQGDSGTAAGAVIHSASGDGDDGLETGAVPASADAAGAAAAAREQQQQAHDAGRQAARERQHADEYSDGSSLDTNWWVCTRTVL